MASLPRQRYIFLFHRRPLVIECLRQGGDKKTMDFMKAALDFGFISYFVEKILDKLGNAIINKSLESVRKEYGIDPHLIFLLKREKNLKEDPSGNTPFSDGCIYAICEILIKYSKANDRVSLQQKLVLNGFKTETIVDEIYWKVKQNNYHWSLQEERDEESIKYGLSLLIRHMVSELQENDEYVALTMQIGNLGAEINEVNRNTENIIEILKQFGEWEPKRQSCVFTNKWLYSTFYQRVVSLCEGKYKSDFLEICGKSTIKDSYIEPYIVEYKRQPLREWIFKTFNGENDEEGNVHVIEGEPGHGKSTACLMTVYDYAYSFDIWFQNTWNICRGKRARQGI